MNASSAIIISDSITISMSMSIIIIVSRNIKIRISTTINIIMMSISTNICRWLVCLLLVVLISFVLL